MFARLLRAILYSLRRLPFVPIGLARFLALVAIVVSRCLTCGPTFLAVLNATRFFLRLASGIAGILAGVLFLAAGF